MRKGRLRSATGDECAYRAALSELEPCVTCGRKRWVHYLPLARRRDIYPSMDGHAFLGKREKETRENGKVATRI
jgi:hypothetical protein